MEEYLEAAEGDMKAAMDQLARELGAIRTGRATPKMLEGVQVDVASYGSVMPITQLATIQAPDARLLTVTPWDKTTLKDIEKGIVAAGLGLNPSNDGQVIRVPVPPLTADRRRDLEKASRTAGEDTKVRIRGVRREYNETFKQGEKDGDISEDDLRRLLEKVQTLTDRFVESVDKVVAAKVAEIHEV